MAYKATVVNPTDADSHRNPIWSGREVAATGARWNGVGAHGGYDFRTHQPHLDRSQDLAFATLLEKLQINVFWQPGTDLHKLASVNNGDIVRVRGLVFVTGTGFHMIARRIDLWGNVAG